MCFRAFGGSYIAHFDKTQSQRWTSVSRAKRTLEWGHRDSLLETAQEAVTITRICALFGPWVNCPYAPTTPPIHFTTISRFLSNFFPRMAPQFFWYTIHQVIWPSPVTLPRWLVQTYPSDVPVFCHPGGKGYAEIFLKTYMGGWLVGFFSKTKFFLWEKYLYNGPFCGTNF